MTYGVFIDKAKEMTVKQLDNGTWYLEPEWQDIISRDITYELDDLEDSYISDWYSVEDILKLEVEKRNAADSKKKEVIDWLHNLVYANIEPAMMAEETEFIKNMVDYMKVSHSGDYDGDEALQKENVSDD